LKQFRQSKLAQYSQPSYGEDGRKPKQFTQHGTSQKKDFSKNPLEIQRFDFAIRVEMEGRVTRVDQEVNGLKVTKSRWVEAKQIRAMAYDSQNAGYNTFNTVSVRLWSALPIFGSDCKQNQLDIIT